MRHALHWEAFLYAALERVHGLLASIYRSDDFAWTIVVDPSTLLGVRDRHLWANDSQRVVAIHVCSA